MSVGTCMYGYSYCYVGKREFHDGDDRKFDKYHINYYRLTRVIHQWLLCPSDHESGMPDFLSIALTSPRGNPDGGPYCLR